MRYLNPCQNFCKKISLKRITRRQNGDDGRDFELFEDMGRYDWATFVSFRR